MTNYLIKKLQKFPLIYSILKFVYIKAGQIFSLYKWKRLNFKREIFLELGSGPKKGKNGWVTIDLWGADINHDLRKGIPLNDNSIDKIYTSHMFEHIPFKELKIFIIECFRVLKVGGELSVSVPNARLYINSYVKKENFRDPKNMYHPAIINTGSWIDQLNYIAYLDGLHHYMFDEENLINTLKLAPFSKVNLRNYDDNLDKSKRKLESIYASAIK